MITQVHKGKYVIADVVDETPEIRFIADTVAGALILSLSELDELSAELKQAKLSIRRNLTKDIVDPLFAKTLFTVEANTFEISALRKEHGDYWDDYNHCGRMIPIGFVDNKPVCFQVEWAKINGILVAFWSATSQVVDYKMIEDWFVLHCNPTHNGRQSRCDAQNFHQCLSKTRELKSSTECV